jgi:glycosyltransferase involved in cell wall biosynthesis
VTGEALPDIWAVIPACNESATIRDLAQRTLAQGVRLIVVDDASCDDTANQLSDLPLVLLRNETNLGKAGSLVRGFGHALASDARAVVTLDGDGQHRPEDIPRLVAAFERHPDCIVIGARQPGPHSPRARHRANCFANFWISWAAGCWIRDSQSGFRVYPAGLLRKIDVRHDRSASFVFESECLIVAGRAGWRSLPVTIPSLYPKGARASHFRPVRDIARIVRMVAWKLISRGLYLPGLARALATRRTMMKIDCDPEASDAPVVFRSGTATKD